MNNIISENKQEISNKLLEEHIVSNNFLTAESVKHSRKISYYFWKRLIDILVSCLGIIVLSPLLIFICLLIKIEDPKGSVIFIQKRVGEDGKIFNMYKFRSMVSNAESLLESIKNLNEVSGHMFKVKNDPRITKIGKIIRATSIDELPQLINVIKGEMSLVGPRPPLLNEVKQYDDKAMQRLMVKPGCTGLWQATLRNSVGFEEMLELDLIYIDKRSTSYDLYIIVITFKALLFRRAY